MAHHPRPLGPSVAIADRVNGRACDEHPSSPEVSSRGANGFHWHACPGASRVNGCSPVNIDVMAVGRATFDTMIVYVVLDDRTSQRDRDPSGVRMLNASSRRSAATTQNSEVT